MGTLYHSIEPQLVKFIERQHMFFVATAAPTGRVNVSPKGLDTFRILGPRRVAWLNGTGSGNETAAHVLQEPRMTIMFCAVEGKPWILRLYGRARMIQPPDLDWPEAYAWFRPIEGARQVFIVDVDECQTSCGFGVPLFEYAGQRDLLPKWAATKGADGIAAYQRSKNAQSLDGFDTGLPPS